MRAIILATGYDPNLQGLHERHAAAMLPLVDRPFLQHIVETLVDARVTEFDFVLSHKPHEIEHLLGTGVRWGSTFRFHLVRNPNQPFKALRAISVYSRQDAQTPIFLVNAQCLIQAGFGEVIDPTQTAELVLMYDSLSPSQPDRQWTGWAVVSSQIIDQIPPTAQLSDVEALLRKQITTPDQVIQVEKALWVESCTDLFDANVQVLQKQFSGLLIQGREVEPGIWISRNVSLHPTAKLIAPVFIGENCRIEPGVALGPNVVIGKDCVLSEGSLIANSLVLPGSFVGEALELNESIVDRNRLINYAVGVSVPVSDDFVLGKMAENPIASWAQRLCSRWVALVLLIVASPIIVLTMIYLKLFRSGKVIFRRQVIELPTTNDPILWESTSLLSFTPTLTATTTPKDLLLRVLPGLVNIVAGNLHFVGVAPRSEAEIEAMSEDWKALYLHCKGGLITEALVQYGENPIEDELYAAEAYYSARMGIRRDLYLIFWYLCKVLNPFGRRLEFEEDPTLSLNGRSLR